MAFCTLSLKMSRFELWYSAATNSYSFIGEGRADRELVTEPDAVLVWVVDAPTELEAMRRRNEYLGLEPYNPMQE